MILKKKKLTIEEKLYMSLDEIIINEKNNKIIDLKNEIEYLKKQKKNVKNTLLKSFRKQQKFKKENDLINSRIKPILGRELNLINKEKEQGNQIDKLKIKLKNLQAKYYNLQNKKIEILDDSIIKNNNSDYRDWNVDVTFLQPVFHWNFNKNIVEVILDSKLEKKEIKIKIKFDNFQIVITEKEELLILGNDFSGIDINIKTLNLFQKKIKDNHNIYIEGFYKNKEIKTELVEKIIKLSRFQLAITKEYPIKIYKLCY